MTYTFQPRGVCSRAMSVEVDDQGVIRDLQVVGGCNGNLQGISALVKGMKAEEAIARLKGINCGGIGTGTAKVVPVFSLLLTGKKHLPSTVRIEWASETESRTERNRG